MTKKDDKQDFFNQDYKAFFAHQFGNTHEEYSSIGKIKRN